MSYETIFRVKMIKTFQIIRSDDRFRFLNDILNQSCMSSSLVEDVNEIHCKNLILPIPPTRDGITISDTDMKIADLSSKLTEDFKIFCGKKELLDGKLDDKIKIFDYSKSELFLLKNAELTSHGIIKILSKYSKKPFNKMKILISGFGRIGKTLTKLLLGLNCGVHVLGNKEKDSFWIDNFGALEVTEFTDLKFDFIINTVPSMIFSNDVIKNINSETFFIDVASKNGIDKKSCEENSMKYLQALGIPGKYFPKESAEIIKESIFNIIGEK